MQRESEDASGEMSIELYLYRSDRYRSTTDSFPFPLPNDRSDPDAVTMEKFLTLEPAIYELLDPIMENVKYTCNLYDQWKESYGQKELKTTTCLIRVVEGPDNVSSWPTMKDAVHLLLQKSGLNSVEVEILDPRHAFMPLFFPQPPSSGSIQLYESVRDELAALLIRKLDSAWVSMSLFRLGSSKEVAIPTIVVFVRPFTTCDWQVLEWTMKNIFADKLSQGQDLGIEFIPGRFSNDVDHASAEDISMHPGMGSSIGMPGSDSSGTMGGFVNLKVGSKVHFGVLTNHHVVVPKRTGKKTPTEAEKEAASTLARMGYVYSSNISASSRIVYPSDEDLRSMREQLTNTVEEALARLSFFDAKRNARAEMGLSPNKILEKSRDTVQEMVEIRQKKLASADQLPIDMGRVLVSSGNSTTRDLSIIDWAFVEMPLTLKKALKREYLDVNVLPDPSHRSLEKADYLETFPLAASHTGVGDTFVAINFGAMEKGKRYFKVGRSSAITVGVCNGTESEINQTGSPRYDEDGKEYIMRGHCARVLTITSMEKWNVNQSPFSKPGDSGSFVVDGDGLVCGLLFGEVTGHVGRRYEVGLGTVTCMTDVRASVGRKTAFRNDEGKEIMGQLSLPLPLSYESEEEKEEERKWEETGTEEPEYRF